MTSLVLSETVNLCNVFVFQNLWVRPLSFTFLPLIWMSISSATVISFLPFFSSPSDNQRQNIWEFWKKYVIFSIKVNKNCPSPKINVVYVIFTSSGIDLTIARQFAFLFFIIGVFQHWFWGEVGKITLFFTIPNIFWRWLSEVQKSRWGSEVSILDGDRHRVGVTRCNH